ncbi:hypothetical protein Esti_004273 [Eimeria stiedai]
MSANFQDWTPVVLQKGSPSPKRTAKEQEINKARRAGEEIEVEKKIAFNQGRVVSLARFMSMMREAAVMLKLWSQVLVLGIIDPPPVQSSALCLCFCHFEELHRYQEGRVVSLPRFMSIMREAAVMLKLWSQDLQGTGSVDKLLTEVLGGCNKATKARLCPNAKKVEEDTGDYHVERVSPDFSKALAEARRNKGMTQAQLAHAINEKPSVISEYESGKAIPNGVILQKMSKALGCQLPKCTQKKKMVSE